MRALDADGMSPTALAVILVAGLGGVWTGWLVTARVPVYQASEAARLEVERVHPIDASVVGRVVATSLVLGREVKEGDVLLEVEAEREKLETSQEKARVTALTGEVDQLQREIAAEQQAIDAALRAGKAALAEAAQRQAATEAALRQAHDKVTRLNQLVQQGLVSVAETEAARADEAARGAEVAAARAGIERLTAEQTADERGRRAKLAALIREEVGLRGQHAATVSSVARFEREAERRRIRAPVSGRLGEVNPIQIGAVIRDGDRLASIIPQGQVRVVAEFAPPALGRLRQGQHARLRLDGFPWTQYGYVDAVVSSVATETRERRVRVELAVNAESNAGSRVPLQHGMPGVVEVEVERVAPLELLVRSLGHQLSGQTAAPAVVSSTTSLDVR
jgi:membrane fusion protein (multidrug efflux system)